ncbi:polyphosphate kinase 1 [Persicirhabdus sediminis]|uniref:Polyphosphate kinase n=1 Tax=Persicirhabdus sediminis TaxID=454144 RepID=A0A8J7MBA9_9BACT|nr:polyphosphate kinase 1 [Persicirhabdus sediminis]MBK1790389.1 polyphosphate kinase 1 [Persicirhabdus sediminis]
MNPSHFINRELSWIEFNQRVLDEALNPDLPLLERLKFLAISGSNLDEFFMVRIGGLMLLHQSGSRKKDIAGLTPYQQLTEARTRLDEMLMCQYQLLNEELIPELEQQGIRQIHDFNQLEGSQISALERVFHESVYPVATPLAIDKDRDIPLFPDLQIAVACLLTNDDNEEPRLAIIPAPNHVPRFIEVPDEKWLSYVTIEDLLIKHLHDFFPGEKVKAAAPFRVTRNGDITLNDENALDLADDMEDILAARKHSTTVRLETVKGVSAELLTELQEVFGISKRETYRIPGLIDLKSLLQIAFTNGFEKLKTDSWAPSRSPQVPAHQSIFETLSEGDVLLYHPYESFDPVIKLIKEASEDPNVLAIKQILYRTASDSLIVDALIKAAENGIQVTVLVELKARFDEARNLIRADELHRAGATVIYGVKGLKTHAKCALVVRKEEGRIKRYCHFGTGNYNESTAKLYTDVSLLTSDSSYGSDASAFFNSVSGRTQIPNYQHIVAAPYHLKPHLLELIQSEQQRAKQGEKAYIWAKVNSLQDPDIINALYKASQAGVSIRLNIRGICCLRPGVKGLSENIKVTSIIDRYLEHARVMLFHQGGQDRVYISSADWMVRNLEKRVELLVPVLDTGAKKRLIKLLKTHLDDNVKARHMLADGSYKLLSAKSGSKQIRAQESLQKAAVRRARRAERERSVILEPHMPKD